MTWRPWIVATMLILAVLVNGTLLFGERIPSVEQTPEVGKIDEKLRTLQYLPGSRRANFKTMGMSEEIADASAGHISRFDRQEEKFSRLLEEQATELVDVFCPSDKLPQPYSALAYLVYDENKVRYVVDPITMRRFERQAWFPASLVPALYDQFERSEGRKGEATIMAVSAALLSKEEAALDGESPWSLGTLGFWGFDRLMRKDPRVQRLVVEYFGLMHYLTELANRSNGICS